MEESKVKAFEDLNVYQRARELINKIYEITRNPLFSKDYGLVDQIRRASVSVMSNIAEGFERGSNTEFIQFLFVAKGSCGEVRTQLMVAFDQKYIERKNYDTLNEQCRLVSGMIGNLITHLKESRYQGNKFKKAPVKTLAEQTLEFLEKVKQQNKGSKA
jgi:four helix bundle protein